MYNLELKRIAKICKNARLRRGVAQKIIAVELGYVQTTICDFERGKNNNAVILNYYITKLFDKYDFQLLGGCIDYDTIGNFFND